MEESVDGRQGGATVRYGGVMSPSGVSSAVIQYAGRRQAMAWRWVTGNSLYEQCAGTGRGGGALCVNLATSWRRRR